MGRGGCSVATWPMDALAEGRQTQQKCVKRVYVISEVLSHVIFLPFTFDLKLGREKGT